MFDAENMTFELVAFSLAIAGLTLFVFGVIFRSARRRGVTPIAAADYDPSAQVLALVRGGHREAAVREVREETGLGLFEAVTLVDELLAEHGPAESEQAQSD